jgi:hypothetical protein
VWISPGEFLMMRLFGLSGSRFALECCIFETQGHALWERCFDDLTIQTQIFQKEDIMMGGKYQKLLDSSAVVVCRVVY